MFQEQFSVFASGVGCRQKSKDIHLRYIELSAVAFKMDDCIKSKFLGKRCIILFRGEAMFFFSV